jgi:hypothetical protein
LDLPHENANNTRTYKKKNFIMSITMRDSDTCSGPKCGFTENMYTSFKELQQTTKSLGAKSVLGERSEGNNYARDGETLELSSFYHKFFVVLHHRPVLKSPEAKATFTRLR